MRDTVPKGIKFSESVFDMYVFTDADWAGDTLTRRSTTGYIVFAAEGHSVAVQASDNCVHIFYAT